MKISEFLPENFQFLEVKFSIYLNRRVFCNVKKVLLPRDQIYLVLRCLL